MTRTPGRTSPTRRRRSSSALRSTARISSNDGLVYVCDRKNNRLQVFRKDGTFVKEAFFAKNSLGDGSVLDIAFSKDPAQTYIYLADGNNMKIRVLRRDTLEELTSFGDGGRQPGQFYARAQHRHRFEGQPLHDGDLRRKAPPEVRLQRAPRRDAQGAGSRYGRDEEADVFGWRFVCCVVTCLALMLAGLQDRPDTVAAQVARAA